MSVAGNAKLVVLIGISMAMFERAPTVFTIVGLVIGLSGCGWYSWYKYTETRAKQEAERLAAMASEVKPPSGGSVVTGRGASESTSLLQAAGTGQGAAAPYDKKNTASSTC